MEGSQDDARPWPPRLPWMVTGLGGVAAVVGCLLPWLVADLGRISILVQSATRTIRANAWDADVYGKVAVLGAVAIVVATLLIALGPRRLRNVFGLLAIVAGAVVTAFAIFEMTTKAARVDHVIRDAFGASSGRTLSDPEFSRLKDILSRLGFSVSLGFGVYLAALGGVAAIVGGAMAAMERRPPVPRTGGFDAAPAAPAPPAPPAPAPPAPEAPPPPRNGPEPPAQPGVDTLPG